jgi:hypothetical protein
VGSIAAMPKEPLHQAAILGDVDGVKKLIDAGAKVDALDGNQMTALVYAAGAGNVNMCKVLLDAKADPNGGGGPVTPLLVAVQTGSVGVVQLLLERGASAGSGVAGQATLTMAEAKAKDMAQIVDLLRAKSKMAPAAVAAPVMPPAPTPAPAGRRGMPGRAGGPRGGAPDAGAEPVTAQAIRTVDANQAIIDAILADANGVLARVKAAPDVNAPVMGVDAKARTEESGWRSHTTDNRSTLVRTVERQFNDEMEVVKKIAESEKAKKTVSDINDLVAKRQKRYAAIYDEMRSVRQTATTESSGTGRGGRGANMGGSMAGRGRGSMTGMPGEAATPAPRASSTRRNTDTAKAGANDASYDGQLQAWTSSNYADKRDLLNAVHELDLKELELLDETARGEKAASTTLAIEGLMVLRDQRVARVNAAMEKEDSRPQRQPASTTTGGRGGRGSMTGGQGTMRGGR